MITISPEYAGHFYDLYINGKENAKPTGDCMKLLMMTLPFMVRDLIGPEVNAMFRSYPWVMSRTYDRYAKYKLIISLVYCGR